MKQVVDSLRVAFVFDWLTSSGGGEQVLQVARTLFPTAPVYTSLYNPKLAPGFSDTSVITSYLQRLPSASLRHQVLIPLMPAAFESFDLKGYDLVISIGNGFSKGVITMPEQFHLSYCQTPPRYLWNLGHDTRNQDRLDSGLRRLAEHQLRIWDVVSSSRPDQILANSKTVAKRIAKIYRRESTVLYPPVDTEHFLPTASPTADYYLSVGRLVYYKRIDLLIEACISTNQRLVIVGEGPERKRLKTLASGHSQIRFLGRQTIGQLQVLYANAKAFLFAGEEDFGIVPVEAMSAGRPVIAFGKGGLTESVLDEVTGKLFFEQTAEALANAITAFKPDHYDQKRIRQHAEQFSVAAFLAGLEEVIVKGVSR